MIKLVIDFMTINTKFYQKPLNQRRSFQVRLKAQTFTTRHKHFMYKSNNKVINFIMINHCLLIQFSAGNQGQRSNHTYVYSTPPPPA